ncbi:MAG: hypothetical protein KKC03_07535 [Bacteroidetes bacterium]|nr:hypothetical protein [Bacteroidota bacterium]
MGQSHTANAGFRQYLMVKNRIGHLSSEDLYTIPFFKSSKNPIFEQTHINQFKNAGRSKKMVERRHRLSNLPEKFSGL